MSRPDSERALQIYKTFTAQTEEVVKFLGVARHFEAATRLEIPKLKHASTDLTRLLEDDLNDPDFELRRREYLAEKEAKRKGGRAPTFTSANNASATKSADTSKPMPSLPKAVTNTGSKAPPMDLIDFFESIEQNQQPMAQHAPPMLQQQQQPGMQFPQAGIQPQQPAFYAQQMGFQQQPQQTGFIQPIGGSFAPQGNNPFGQPQVPQPLQPTPTGAGFGGYSAQPQSYGFQSNLAPIPQNDVATFPQQQQQQQQQPMQVTQQPQSTNPFRQSMLANQPTGSTTSAGGVNRQSTNPFARHVSTGSPQFSTGSAEAFSSAPMQQSQAFQPQPQPLQVQRTGTNPFARSATVPPQQPQGLQPLRPNPTGSTNPFRQSAFINQQTGQGWQVGHQGTMGGLEQLETVPIFPRPGMA